MEPITGKPSLLKNILIRAFSFAIAVLVLRFAYVVTVRGGNCDSIDFCFFPETLNLKLTAASGNVRPSSSSSSSSAAAAARGEESLQDLWTSKKWRKWVDYYSSVFQDLITEGFLSPDSKALCLETLAGQDVFALREIGVVEAIGISKNASPPLVVSGTGYRQPFDEADFDFEFSAAGGLDRSVHPVQFVSEMERTLKPGGFAVIHALKKDVYSFDSLLNLFNSCRLVKVRDIDGLDSSSSSVREIVLKKDSEILGRGEKTQSPHANSGNKCSVPGYKRELIRESEPLITEEPMKPWITLKRNLRNIKYLSSMVDISFKRRYVYVDVGARSYGSSIGSWFKKQYPKQNKTFEIYAIEADKAFHEEYRRKKGVTLLPLAAWVRNETLFFEISREPSHKVVEKGRGMGRIQSAQSSTSFMGDVDNVQGFDFAEWLKKTVLKKDYVVVKMDVEGAEFHLIPRLIKTGAICLVDEIFLECHYNRWQRCCPGERTSKYQKTYAQCLDLLSSLRESGVLVHQWW